MRLSLPVTRWLRRTTAAAVALAAAAASGAAQGSGPIIHGVVVDSAGNPLAGAVVEIHGARREATTNAEGRFRFDDLRRGRYWLSARSIGYRPYQASLTLENEIRQFRIVLEAAPFELPEVVVKAQAGLYERRMRDFLWRSRSAFGGRFLTQDDILRSRARDLGDLVVRYMPFKRRYAMDQGGGFAAVFEDDPFSTSRLTRRTRFRPDCPPAVAINGGGVSVGFAVNDFDPDEVEAVEVYREGVEVPIEYTWSRQIACGLVVIWLKSYSRAGGTG